MNKKFKILIIGRSLKHKKVGGIVHISKQIMETIDTRRFIVNYFVNGSGHQKAFAIIIRPFQIILNNFRFYLKLIIFKPSLIHINTSLGWKSIIRDSSFLIIAKLFKFPTLLFIHGWKTKIGNKFVTNRKAIISLIFTKIFHLPNSIIVLSKTFKKHLACLGIDSKKIFVVPNMVNCHQFSIQAPEIEKYKKSKDNYTILFMSRFVKEKGVYELIKSIPLIIEKGYSNIELILAGDGNEKKNMKELCKKLKITNSVSFLGYVRGQEKIIALKKANLFILPSYSEGLPIVLLEAMAAGLPIITTKAGGITEIIKNEINGILLNNVNENNIANAIIAFIKNPKFAAEIKKANLKKIRLCYHTPLVLKKIEKIYTNSISKNM